MRPRPRGKGERDGMIEGKGDGDDVCSRVREEEMPFSSHSLSLSFCMTNKAFHSHTHTKQGFSIMMGTLRFYTWLMLFYLLALKF